MSNQKGGNISKRKALQSEKDDRASLRMKRWRMKQDVTKKSNENKDIRKAMKSSITREFLRWTFAIIILVLLGAFGVEIFSDDKEIFASPALTVLFSSLFGLLTLVVGFIAGSNIGD